MSNFVFYHTKLHDLVVAKEEFRALSLKQRYNVVRIYKVKLREVLDQLEGDGSEILEDIARQAIEAVRNMQGEELL